MHLLLINNLYMFFYCIKKYVLISVLVWIIEQNDFKDYHLNLGELTIFLLTTDKFK